MAPGKANLVFQSLVRTLILTGRNGLWKMSWSLTNLEEAVMKNILKLIGVSLILILSMANVSATAADYPTKPITLICTAAPGGSDDTLGRAFAIVAEKYLGQPVVVVNKAGASGMIGGLAGAQAAPDGYTLTITATTLTSAIEFEIAEGRKPPFTRHDFANIVAFNMSPTLIIVPYDSPWKTVNDLVNDAKAKPDHYVFCSGSLYSSSHVPAELLASAFKLKFNHVPYTGGGECISALVGKHADFGTQYPGSSIPLIMGKKLRALAVQANQRLKALPDVPSVKELGLDIEFYGWAGISAPSKTPMPIVEKLRQAAKKVVEDKTYIDMIEKRGDEVRFKMGDEMTQYWDTEAAMIAKLIKKLLSEGKK